MQLSFSSYKLNVATGIIMFSDKNQFTFQVVINFVVFIFFVTQSQSGNLIYFTSYARQKDANAHVILPGAHRSARHVRRTFDTCFTLSLICHLYVLFVRISYQARFGLKISYPAIVFTMVIGLLNCGSFIVHILLLGTSKVFTLSVFLPCACVHVLLPGTPCSTYRCQSLGY